MQKILENSKNGHVLKKYWKVLKMEMFARICDLLIKEQRLGGGGGGNKINFVIYLTFWM